MLSLTATCRPASGRSGSTRSAAAVARSSRMARKALVRSCACRTAANVSWRGWLTPAEHTSSPPGVSHGDRVHDGTNYENSTRVLTAPLLSSACMSAALAQLPEAHTAGHHGAETVVSAAGASDPGRVRSLNQDAYHVGRVGAHCQLGVVADGMGGHISGELASRRAVEVLVETLQASRANPPVALARAAQAANVEVYNHAALHPEHKGMGTTLTAVLIDDQVGLVGHVGDSRAYLLREGELRRLTDDHSWVADRVRQGLLSEDEASKHRYRNVITNAIGATPTFRLDVLHFEVQSGDTLLIVSDGVSMLLSEPL